MKYRFENTYTQSELIKWQMKAADGLNSNTSATSLIPAYLVFVVQFALWTPILYFLSAQDISFALMAILLFVSFVVIGVFYDICILPHVVAHFHKSANSNKMEKSCAIIDIDDEEIRTRDGDQEVIFKWSGIRSVEDYDTTVFLFTEKGYCLIPARCFAGFLAKDAFVRDCREKISGRTEQGTHFV